MSNFAILRNGSLVQHVVFIGDGLYREHKIEVLTFETVKQAEELLSVWKDAEIVDYSQTEEKLAA